MFGFCVRMQRKLCIIHIVIHILFEINFTLLLKTKEEDKFINLKSQETIK